MNYNYDDNSKWPPLLVFKSPVLWTANNRNWTRLGLEKTGTAVPVFQFLRIKDCKFVVLKNPSKQAQEHINQRKTDIDMAKTSTFHSPIRSDQI